MEGRKKERRLPVHGPACIRGSPLTQPQTSQRLRRVQTARIHCAGCGDAALALLLGAVLEAGAAIEVMAVKGNSNGIWHTLP